MIGGRPSLLSVDDPVKTALGDPGLMTELRIRTHSCLICFGRDRPIWGCRTERLLKGIVMIRQTFIALGIIGLSAGSAAAQNVNYEEPVQQDPPQAKVTAPPAAAPVNNATVQAPPVAGGCGNGCATVPANAEGCTTDGCADACGEEGCLNHDLNAIFGDKPLLGCLRDREAGPFKYSVGGALRYRYMDEKNRFRPGGPAQSDYQLWRFTPFIDMSYDDKISAHVEAIDASAFGYDSPLFPLGIDVNRFDLLRAYVDFKLADVEGGGTLHYRFGRQFLKYGSQHLLSPLGWANTYRNFEGHKLMYSTKDWDIDGFYMQSVNAPAGGTGYGPVSFDTPDSDRTISGIYSTYKGMKDSTLDLYWLHFNEANLVTNRMGGERDTFGARLAGTKAVKECNKVVGMWNWDVEGALQTGNDEFGNPIEQNVFAGFFSAIGGYRFNSMRWAPTVNGIFYYGSGDDDPTDGDINTVYTLYPLGHAYWGLIDNFSGQNLIDYGISASVKPHEKFTFLAAWHKFKLAEANDNLYNLAGAPFALASDDIGSEVDLVGTLAVTKNINVQLGYFWFFYGDGVNNSAFARPDAGQFYAQTVLTF
jgi:hypothetical protein